MSLQNVADEYFSTLNPIASRLYADLQETRGAYEDLWKKLSPEDQDQILTESIIKPEISIKYDVPQSCRSDDYAVKVVVDDHCSYRDEHSGPFTFRTKSQRNLTIFHEERLKVKPQRETVPKLVSKAVPKKPNVPLYIQETQENIDLEDISCQTTKNEDASSNSNTLPKTGLDFLDNW